MNIKQKMIAKKSIQKKKKTERNDKIREILNERDRQKRQLKIDIMNRHREIWINVGIYTNTYVWI